MMAFHPKERLEEGEEYNGSYSNSRRDKKISKSCQIVADTLLMCLKGTSKSTKILKLDSLGRGFY